MKLTRLKLEKFTAFDKLDLELSGDVNIFVGANGTGKTHIMKVLYAASDITKTKRGFADKLVAVFSPSNNHLGRLVKRQVGVTASNVEVRRERLKLIASFHSKIASPESATVKGLDAWLKNPVECVFIPVKEMLSNAPGFRSLYEQRELHFEEVYSDILARAAIPPLRGPYDERRKKLMEVLKDAIDGSIISKNEEYYHRSDAGELEFPLVAEGSRKLGLLWLLIQNSTLTKGSILFWDEPETNLNPKLYPVLIDIMVELSKLGVQIFLATHDYAILRGFDLVSDRCKITYHALYRNADNNIECNSTDSFMNIEPNAIDQAYGELYDRVVERELKGR